MSKLKFKGSEINKILDGRLHSPTHDVVGDNYLAVEDNLIMAANTKYRFECNGNIREKIVVPSHVSKLWDKTNNKSYLSELLDTPQVVFNLRVSFDPDAASSGIFTFTPSVDEDTPIQFKPVQVAYKSSAGEVYALVTIYAGNDLGFDVKNKNVFFDMEATGSGKVYDINSIEIYRT